MIPLDRRCHRQRRRVMPAAREPWAPPCEKSPYDGGAVGRNGKGFRPTKGLLMVAIPLAQGGASGAG